MQTHTQTRARACVYFTSVQVLLGTLSKLVRYPKLRRGCRCDITVSPSAVLVKTSHCPKCDFPVAIQAVDSEIPVLLGFPRCSFCHVSSAWDLMLPGYYRLFIIYIILIFKYYLDIN